MEYIRDFKIEADLKKNLELGKARKPTLKRLGDIKLHKMIQQDSFSNFRFSQRGRAMISPITTKSIHVSALDKPRFLSTNNP